MVAARGEEAPPPQRTLLGAVNSHLICVLCGGYYVDATTIVECLHSFCRSCIVKHLRGRGYCPVCEVMINTARPNIKPDKALQDIVYKLVPGLFQREMARRRAFYQSRPHLAADATPEQRGEDTERIVFSPDDVISFSLEYMDADSECYESESGSDAPPSEEPPPPSPPSRRYLRCPAVVNVLHLKKFLTLKFDVDPDSFFVEILYKRVPLPDYYTLMDVAYIYNWKRIDPMRFYYHITDFSHARKRPAPSESPRRPLADPSEDSSGDRTPSPDGADSESEGNAPADGSRTPSRAPPDVEKSQFLNSFELTARRDAGEGTSATRKSDGEPEQKRPRPESPEPGASQNAPKPAEPTSPKTSDKIDTTPSPQRSIARTQPSATDRRTPPATEKPPLQRGAILNDQPKVQLEPLKKIRTPLIKTMPLKRKLSDVSNQDRRAPDPSPKRSTSDPSPKRPASDPSPKRPASDPSPKRPASDPSPKRPASDPSPKRPVPDPSPTRPAPDASPKRPACDPSPKKPEPGGSPTPSTSKGDPRSPSRLTADAKFNPTVKITANPQQPTANRPAPPALMRPGDIAAKRADINKETQRLMAMKHKQKSEGENPLKSLFNSCKINIPPSLSITIKEDSNQKQGESAENVDSKKQSQSTNGAMTPTPSTSSQPSAVGEKNYLEIIKLPEGETPKTSEVQTTQKNSASTTKNKDAIVSAKGPIPNLKPISEAKNVPFTKPQTFQQTFLQSLQQQKEKAKYNKRLVLPKVNPNSAAKPEDTGESTSNPKPIVVPKSQTVPLMPQIQRINAFPKTTKSDSALDLSTPHPIQSKLGPQQAKALEMMQSITNLAKRQKSYNQRPSGSQNFLQDSFKLNQNINSSIRVPVPTSTNNSLKINTSLPNNSTCSPKHFPDYQSFVKQSMPRSPNDLNLNQSPKSLTQQSSFNQNSERLQQRSPSSSPKLVIACPSPKSQSPEQKQFISPKGQESSSSQSNLISSSSQISNINNEASGSKDPSKVIRNIKPVPIANKLNNIRGPSVSNAQTPKQNNSNSDLLMTPELLARQAYIRQQLELQTHLGFLPTNTGSQWYNDPRARAHFENIVKNMTQSAHKTFNSNLNNKDK